MRTWGPGLARTHRPGSLGLFAISSVGARARGAQPLAVDRETRGQAIDTIAGGRDDQSRVSISRRQKRRDCCDTQHHGQWSPQPRSCSSSIHAGIQFQHACIAAEIELESYY